MFSIWFLISLGLLLAALLVSVFVRSFPRLTGGAVLVFVCTTLLLAAGMFAEKAAGGRFTFLNPAFLFLLLLPILLWAIYIFRSGLYNHPLDYPLTGFLRD